MDGRRQKYVPSLHFSFLTPLYDVLMPLAGEAALKRSLIVSADIRDGQQVLDLGCGTATLTIMVKSRYPVAEVTGLDYDSDALGWAFRKTVRAGIDVRLIRGTAFQLPFADGCLDRVVSSLVFHHLTTENKPRTLREVYRVLRPSGEFLLADFGVPRGPVMSFLAAVMGLVEKTGDNVKGLLPGMMAAAGFTDVAVVREFASPFGTLAFYRGKKPGQEWFSAARRISAIASPGSSVPALTASTQGELASTSAGEHLASGGVSKSRTLSLPRLSAASRPSKKTSLRSFSRISFFSKKRWQ